MMLNSYIEYKKYIVTLNSKTFVGGLSDLLGFREIKLLSHLDFEVKTDYEAFM